MRAGSRIGSALKQLLVERCRGLATPQAAREYLIAPLAEEFVFRACMLPLLLAQAGAPAAIRL